MIKAAVIGAAGFTGGELVRLIAEHPSAELSVMTGHSNAGKNILEVFPYLRKFSDCMIEEFDADRVASLSDVAFLALPSGISVDIAEQLLQRNVKVIDLGADFRFDEVADYESWYKMEHHNAKLNEEAVYGLPEIWRDKVSTANLVANPGCYPTASTLGIYPLVKNSLIDLQSVIIDAKSGVSGAGRTPKLGSLYSECNDSIGAYNVAKHRHTPEIEQNLRNICGEDVLINFTPHLTPMTRGIHATIYANLNEKGLQTDIYELYQQTFQDEYFVRILSPGVMPQTKWVTGSNFCDINVTVDKRTGRVIICSVIDNLFKGASGQAIQNMNILFGLDEKTGIDRAPMFP